MQTCHQLLACAAHGPWHMQVQPVWAVVRVLHCSMGQVQQTPQTCVTCPPATFSFNPDNFSCDPCPDLGSCAAGGAGLVPLAQYWHSAPDSDYIVTCPNGNACQGNRTTLMACKTASYGSVNGTVANVSCSVRLSYVSLSYVSCALICQSVDCMPSSLQQLLAQ